ncbi:MAG: LicD family protein [Bacteroidetes bacterium]|nr:LicD family protein [Bacteroidota bacterium]
MYNQNTEIIILKKGKFNINFFRKYYRLNNHCTILNYNNVSDIELFSQLKNIVGKYVVIDDSSIYSYISKIINGKSIKLFSPYTFGIFRKLDRYLPYNNWEIDIAPIQSELLRMMKSIHHICEKYNIPYVIHAGSLLGAIRHKGFIPWDDDLDILMLRKDYERFFVVASNENVKDFQLVTPYISNKKTKYLNQFICLSNKIKCTSRYSTLTTQYHDNLTLDICPLDSVPNRNSFIQHFKKNITIFLNIAYRQKIDKFDFRQHEFLPAKFFSILPVNVLVRLNTFTLKIFNSFYENKMLHFFSADNNKETFNTKTFYSSIIKNRELTMFEDAEFYIPENYDSVLKSIFGEDYMEIPQDCYYNHSILFFDDRD